MKILQEVKDLVEDRAGERIQCIDRLSGGCINQAAKVTFSGRAPLFLKTNRAEFHSVFQAESLGLQSLAETNAIRVAKPIEFGTVEGQAFLLMEWIESGNPTARTSEQLGRKLAEMHLRSGESRFGFESENFLGATLQQNRWSTDWGEFFLEQRLGFQLRLAAENGFSQWVSSQERILKAAARRLRNGVQPSLIHGDLWGGNYLVDRSGDPVLLDPAPYWADREAEFGILTLFGGFDARFHAAYRETAPLDDEFEERLVLYQLYHYLNHLNLFGIGYASDCQRLISRLV